MTAYPLRRGRNLIVGALLAVAAAAWVLLSWESRLMGRPGMSPTMGLTAAPFAGVWIAMMIAMMFPAATPMILMFARVSASKRQQGLPFVPTWVFVGAYLLVWALFGIPAYAVAAGADRLAEHSMWLMTNGARIGGLLIVAAGVYQFSPIKRVCLSKCRSPLQFVLAGWRDGYGGAFRMGLEHGLYCLGCCWLLFAILFPLGIMNVAAMAVIALLVIAEKTLPLGRQIGMIAAAVLILCGTLVLFLPGTLPAMT